MKAAAVEAGIKKRVDIHTFRHSYGSNKIRMGWGLRKVSQILGHSDIQATASYYSHLLDGDLKIRDEILTKEKASGLEEATQVFIRALMEKSENEAAEGISVISEAISKEVLRRIQLMGANLLQICCRFLGIKGRGRD